MTSDERALVERASSYAPAYGGWWREAKSDVGEIAAGLLALVRRLDAENERMRLLLEPFARHGAAVEAYRSMKNWPTSIEEVKTRVTDEECIAVHRALAGPEPQDGKEV